MTIIDFDTARPYRPIVQCEPSKEVTDMCGHYAAGEGACVLFGCKDCPARLYEVPIIEIVDAPVSGFWEGYLIGAIIFFAVLSGVAAHIGMGSQESAYQSDRRVG